MRARTGLRTVPGVLAACLLATTLASGQTPYAAAPPAPSVKTGDAAPDFTANYLAAADPNGKRDRKAVKLSEFRGHKNVVLAFFPAAFSPGCTSEMAKYQENTGEFNANNTVVLGMSVDSVWANVAFAEKLGVKFNILSDAKRDISRAYGVFDESSVVARRTTFVIDRQGVVQKVFMAQEALDPSHALATCALLKEVK
ncbi:MAG: redoxin domain-containing protein [Candidatus Rokuibacteriota bacterium]